MTPTSPAPPTRPTGPGRLRIGAVAGAAVALAVGAAATSLAAAPDPGSTDATGWIPAAQARSGIGSSDADRLFDHGRLGGPRGFGDITISAISGSSITLETDDGWTRTIAVSSSVELTKGGQDIEVSDLKVGDSVRFAQTRNDDGSYAVTAIAVVVPTVSGTVKDVTAGGFTLTTRDGSTWTVNVDGDTAYRYGSGAGSRSDVVAGATVLVQGESPSDNTIDATSVTVAAAHTVGTVTGKTSDTITITTRDGSTRTIHVDGDTTYEVAGVTDADLGDIAVDMTVVVEGRARDDGSLDASAVRAGIGRGHGLLEGLGVPFLDGPSDVFGGFGGFGRGPQRDSLPGWGEDDQAAPSEAPSSSS